MNENAKSQDGGDKTPSISMLKLNKLHVFIHFFNLIVADKYILVSKKYILYYR